jgi:hypothetical protein
MTWTSSSLPVVAGPSPERAHRLAGVLVALLLLPMTALGVMAHDAGSNTQAGQAASEEGEPAKAKLPSVTIEAAREHALRLKVDHFVTSVIVQPWGDALYRWTKPVCPLVAGLPTTQGEFVLARISKAAIDADVPLAGRVCSPNLFVVAIGGDPNPLLEAWWEHDRLMYNLRTQGIEAVQHFIHSTRPIRVWYNSYVGCNDDAAATSTLAYILMPGVYHAQQSPMGCEAALGSHIVRMSTGSDISSAIIVVDGRQMKNVNLGQMADYIALIGLADVRFDANSTAVPSILELFGHGTPPQGLTRWDRALLYSLYNTSHMSTLEVPEMELTMVRRIER